MITPTQAIMAVLAAGNLLLGWAWLSARDDATTAAVELVSMQEQRDGALKGAQSCSDATEALAAVAAQRAAEAAPARAAAAEQAHTLNARADYTLATAPAAPGDSCASLQALGAQWLKGRAKP
ncbi:hypothetical protein HMPREF9701_06437 [Delftia acidovorans CCUG 274B]|uniref:hypothetical protein n=1 Tax=Delftia acidovorans TaxID=80866 RepID=UPI000352D2E0|nr:hypothetical protein [Delftia acidovorans]EPD32747.1 hypothetical protein HMPREF9701_06437 [Delftia acidovorans CCUG 274B]PZP57745.1 MAG: hypothetical protein DI604_34315 [Delftia acidovorans]